MQNFRKGQKIHNSNQVGIADFIEIYIVDHKFLKQFCGKM